MVEKLSHKVRDVLDSSYDRYNRRLGYAEERLEMALKKVQVRETQKLKYLIWPAHHFSTTLRVERNS